MITIRVLGTATDEEHMQHVTKKLAELCHQYRGGTYYIEFPSDRMQMELGMEIVGQIFCEAGGVYYDRNFGLLVNDILKGHFPKATVGIQMIEAKTIVEIS